MPIPVANAPDSPVKASFSSNPNTVNYYTAQEVNLNTNNSNNSTYQPVPKSRKKNSKQQQPQPTYVKVDDYLQPMKMQPASAHYQKRGPPPQRSRQGPYYLDVY